MCYTLFAATDMILLNGAKTPGYPHSILLVTWQWILDIDFSRLLEDTNVGKGTLYWHFNNFIWMALHHWFILCHVYLLFDGRNRLHFWNNCKNSSDHLIKKMPDSSNCCQIAFILNFITIWSFWLLKGKMETCSWSCFQIFFIKWWQQLTNCFGILLSVQTSTTRSY